MFVEEHLANCRPLYRHRKVAFEIQGPMRAHYTLPKPERLLHSNSARSVQMSLNSQTSMVQCVWRRGGGANLKLRPDLIILFLSLHIAYGLIVHCQISERENLGRRLIHTCAHVSATHVRWGTTLLKILPSETEGNAFVHEFARKLPS